MHMFYLILQREVNACPMYTPEGRRKLTAKVYEALTYIHTHFNSTFDWVLKADDDTYIIMENLKAFLSQYSPTESKYFGHVLTHEKSVRKGHPSGGAGYLLSSRTLDILQSKGKCKNGRIEDLNVAQCLQALAIYPEDIRDHNGIRLSFPDVWTFQQVLQKRWVNIIYVFFHSFVIS